VSWAKVTRPVELGGSRVLDLATLGYALCLRWEWLACTDPNRSWSVLPFKPEKVVRTMIDISTTVQVGNGARALFWCGRWLDGKVINDPAPQVAQVVCKNVISSMRNQVVSTLVLYVMSH
jgi:hypothetical protein